MPLLGKVIFNEPLRKCDPDGVEQAFIIPHTQEAFSSREEYEDRVQLYNRRVWTCQCTGHINMTHEEAVESEQKSREILSHSFPEIYERPVLAAAHHFSDVLDKIVNRAYRLVRTQHFVDEKVNFEATPGRKFDAKIVKVINELEQDEHLNNNGSPSSDKENHSAKQSLITDMFKSATTPERDTKSSGSSQEDTPDGKIEPTNYKYDILLETENKIIRGVPGNTITCTTRPPTRHILRLFIRSNAIRHDYKKKKAWIVDKSMVKKYDLINRLSREEEENFLKASSIQSNGFVGYTHHSQPLTNGTTHHNGDSALDSEEKEDSQDGDTQEELIKTEGNTISDSSTPSKQIKLAPIFSPQVKKKKLKKEPEDDKSSVECSSIDYASLDKSDSLFSKKSETVSKKERQRKRKSKSNTESSPKKKQKKVGKGGKSLDDDNKPLSKHASSQPSPSSKSRKSSSPKKKKQATLLELTRKKGGMMLMTSTKSPALGSSPSSPTKSPRAPRQPPIVYQLLRLKKEKKFQVHKYSKLVDDAARMLNEKQKKNLPDLVKQDIMLKWRAIERKREWDSKTTEERKMIRAKERVKRNKKFEDMDIVAIGKKVKPLPSLELAFIPGNLPNCVFGDIAMVVEFLNSYKTVISPRDSKITHSSLAEALSAGKQGYNSVSRIMILIFRMLLSDGIAQDYKELDFRIDSVPLTPEVCSELARICLRQLDDVIDEENLDKSDDQVEDDVFKMTGTGIKEEVFLKLLDNEIYEMDPDDQLEVLCALVYRLINTYSAQQYRDEVRKKASLAWIKLNKMRTKENLLKKEKRIQKKEEKGKDIQEPKPKVEEKVVTEDNDPADLISRVKRRRIDAAEKRQQEEENRIQYDEEKRKLFEEQEREAEHDKLVRQMRDTESQHSTSLRMNALGSDRHHNRYWLFSDCTPGLYVEKGWAQDYINYTTQSESESMKSSEPVTCSPSSEDEVPLSLLGHTISSNETSLPHIGQNLWFVIDTNEQLDEILSSLCVKGIRESRLKKALEKKYNHIIRSITKYQASLPVVPEPLEDGVKPPSPHVTPKSPVVKDAEQDVKKSLRKRMQTMIHDVCKGRLSKIEDEYEVYVARIESAQEIGDFSALILDIFNAIDMRFFHEYMSGIAKKKNMKRDDLLPFEEQEKSITQKKLTLAEKRRERWFKAVKGATHLSRLSFLLTILHSNVMWEMFKYCRTQGKRQSARIKNYADMVEDQSEEEEEEEQEEEEDDDEEEEEEEEEEDPRGCLRGGLRSRKLLRNRKLQDEEEEEEEDSENDEEEGSDAEEENVSQDYSQDEEEERESLEEYEGEEEEESEEDEEKEDLERSLTVINKLLQYKCSGLFRYPVEEEDVPDYYEVIDNPMSLSEIKIAIEKSMGISDNTAKSSGSRTRSADRPAELPKYSPDQLLEDVRLVLDNAEMYNGNQTIVWRQALKLKSAFIRCFSEQFRHSVRLTKRVNRLFDNVDAD